MYFDLGYILESRLCGASTVGIIPRSFVRSSSRSSWIKEEISNCWCKGFSSSRCWDPISHSAVCAESGGTESRLKGVRNTQIHQRLLMGLNLKHFICCVILSIEPKGQQ